MRYTECKTVKDRQRFAMEYHGIECQQRKLVEEVHELNEAITKYETMNKAGTPISTDCILTEVADVLNVIGQIQMKYCLDNIEVNKEKTKKIERHFTEMVREIDLLKNGLLSND